MTGRTHYRRTGLTTVMASIAAGALVLSPGSAAADPPELAPRDANVRFHEIAVPGSALAGYRRAPSPENAVRVANKQRKGIVFGDYATEPVHDRGIAGVVTFDYDGDDDLDLFVTNGPGRANSLYQNRLGRTPERGKTGKLGFTDVAGRAGVALPSVDANGACAGDIDNDGDMDLYVLGKRESNHLLLNRGNGTFRDITHRSGTGAGSLSHISCTMADFEGDGLIDIAIANTFDMRQALAIFAVPYALHEPNQLLRNQNGRKFTDVSTSSGFTALDVPDLPPGPAGPGPIAEMSWAIAAVDYDQDGDPDLVVANDQAAYPMKKYGGLDRGLLRIHRNDGRGHFTDVTHSVGTDEPGAWMGLAFGDLNFDGTIDIFGSSGGDYMFLPLPEMGIKQGDLSSRWFLQRPDHTFADPRRSSLAEPLKDGADPTLGGLNATPWGWGSSMFDYDNDTDTDIIYHGALDGMFWVTADNPGSLLRNEGSSALRRGFYPSFHLDSAALKGGKNHRKRTVTGVAVGDLNRDGFEDIVTVAQSRKVGGLTAYAADAEFDFNSPFDRGASFLKTYQRTGGGPAVPSITLQPTPTKTVDGDLSVEINGGNANGSAAVRTLGSVGLTRDGRVNRDGIGAVVTFTPRGGNSAIRPVIAGSSFASQDSLEGTFGLGRQRSGTVEILWPGGVRNKLYNVRAGERITFPEIPCSYRAAAAPNKYARCVTRALADLVKAGELTRAESKRFLSSALRAFDSRS